MTDYSDNAIRANRLLKRLRMLVRDNLNGPDRVTPDREVAELFEELDFMLQRGCPLPLEWHVGQAIIERGH